MKLGESPQGDLLEALNKKKERIFSPLGLVLNVNNTVKKDAADSMETVPRFTIPQEGNLFNVQVSLAASPWNFVVSLSPSLLI